MPRKNIIKRTLKDGTKVKIKGDKDGGIKKIIKRKGWKRTKRKGDFPVPIAKKGGAIGPNRVL